jgi:hypothetical protein
MSIIANDLREASIVGGLAALVKSVGSDRAVLVLVDKNSNTARICTTAMTLKTALRLLKELSKHEFEDGEEIKQ